ncbi:hypothetical protein SPRG_06751 [Saprolegnia parasitica CBS 223.65]|uniref:Uncharacterized protein n=1 Tax=Saprolegnia parasitica (strain CBS 223.65) TaxID=695850 RepID=A0A067CNW0_SAPPC|nr:hypothetical protein SPRG_06751 [Saprolegnia parasitica CBS 223.65]KDO28512.1 hypothetical protein SPRG_06751 [Saprolegnia parasitica CBS 223.65]|eukprot:XP_012200948.1 hypothetical protein SPRG_06751 [Saprolegnia parasitica CBS 223.65]
MADLLKTIWGSGQSRAFKVGSWAAAAGLAVGWYLYDKNKEASFSTTDADAWNKEILAKKQAKDAAK